VIYWIALYDGTTADLRLQTEPLHNLEPAMTDLGETPYARTPEYWLSSDKDPGCSPGVSVNRYPADFERYNTTAVRRAYQIFAEKVKTVSAFNTSILAFEQYATQGVKAVPADSTAFPHRDDNVLS
jgi:hypothetical protein